MVEVAPNKQTAFEAALNKAAAPFALIGEVAAAPRLAITHKGRKVIDSDLASLKAAWKQPLSKI